MIDFRDAMARTTLLTRDIYPTLTGEQIVAGLTTTAVLIRADLESCRRDTDRPGDLDCRA